MLDERSLEIISKFKQSLVTAPAKSGLNGSFANRGSKSIAAPTSALLNSHILTPKIVEYEGSKRLVLTNDSIERNNHRRKRKWRQTYGDPAEVRKRIRQKEEQQQHFQSDEADEDEQDEAQQAYNTNNNNTNRKQIAISKENGHRGDDDEGEADYDEEQGEDFSEPDSDGDFESETSDSEAHPFSRINLTEILTPLTHPSEIISHPAISKTYNSQVFRKLASELIELIELEQENLNWLNKLLQVLNGEDWFYLLEENLGLPKYDHGLNQVSDDETPNTSVVSKDGDSAKEKAAASETTTEREEVSSSVTEGGEDSLPKRITRTAATQEDKEKDIDPFFAVPEALKTYEAYQTQQLEDTSSTEEIIKEELVNYLQVSIQRQQEYIKNLTQLRNGIVRSDRLKGDLFKWGKEMHDKRSS
ncbi:hypothetical protein CLIB1423_05S01002 [[Candida] railenensis]|uniref:Transcriptional regulatory protein RXT2 N-terminal domain-containing protein n=1 Tax=[Candida] railenensis TaxID=45579 RepID=A0A9P0QNB1_9ASCO|nr:hypothetical protein CLIB1423_05S01002 [[Candida] railenensis]